ncbi:MAG: hypothetical protein QM500_08600 [Methylococcales bacterium]
MMLRHIDILAEDWAHDIQTLMDRSCLNYPNASSIARVDEGGSHVPGSKCPEMFTTGRVTVFHLLYKDLPNKHKKIVHKQYIKAEKLNSREYHILGIIHQNIDVKLKVLRDNLRKVRV